MRKPPGKAALLKAAFSGQAEEGIQRLVETLEGAGYASPAVASLLAGLDPVGLPQSRSSIDALRKQGPAALSAVPVVAAWFREASPLARDEYAFYGLNEAANALSEWREMTDAEVLRASGAALEGLTALAHFFDEHVEPLMIASLAGRPQAGQRGAIGYLAKARGDRKGALLALRAFVERNLPDDDWFAYARAAAVSAMANLAACVALTEPPRPSERSEPPAPQESGARPDAEPSLEPPRIDELVAWLAREAGSGSLERRRAALLALGRLGRHAAAAAPAIWATLKLPLPDSAAANALRGAALGVLLDVMDTGSLEAADLGSAPQLAARRAADALHALARADADPAVRAAALAQIAGSGPWNAETLDLAIAAAQSESAEVRRAAILLLGALARSGHAHA